MLTPKQEKFAQGVAAGLSQSDAYRAAYDAENMKPSTIQNKAHVVMKNGDVRARVDALRQPVIEKMQYGLQEAMAEAAEAYRVSMAKDNGSAMVSAVALRAKLNGLLVDRQAITVSDVSKLDDAALDALIALKTAEVGLTPESSLH
jgi:phage terminase small subunit